MRLAIVGLAVLLLSTEAAAQAPVANAGPDQTVAVGALVHLTGSGSTDPNGIPLTFSWSLTTRPSGSTAVLSSATTVNPTFVADMRNQRRTTAVADRRRHPPPKTSAGHGRVLESTATRRQQSILFSRVQRHLPGTGPASSAAALAPTSGRGGRGVSAAQEHHRHP